MDLPSKDKPYESWKAVRDSEQVRNSVLEVLNVFLSASDAEQIASGDGTNYEAQLKAWIKAKGIDDKSFEFVTS